MCSQSTQTEPRCRVRRPNCVVALARRWTGGFIFSDCRTLCSATLGPAWGLEPCPASSSDRVINAKHIDQLSRFHAQKTLSFKFCSVRPSIILLLQKVVCEKIPCHNFVCDTQIQIPHLFGGFLYEVFSLAYDYTCTASFLVRVLRHNMHHIDLSIPQAGLPCSCVYPYAPDYSARE